MSASSAASSAPDKPSSSPFRVPAAVEELLLRSVLSAPPSGSVQGSKEALSVGATTVNFRRFVQKSGLIFVAQDAVEAVFRWEDPAKTCFFGALWALLCYWPTLALFIPNVTLVAVLLHTYQAKRRAPGGAAAVEAQDGPTGLAKEPPAEAGVDYFANLQNIQITMGRVADLTDQLRSLVPYLTWRDERLTRALLHSAVVSSFALALLAPFIPWRLVFFLLGEGALLAGHPLSQALLAQSVAYARTPEKEKKRRQMLRRLLEDDELRDEELDGGCEVVEVQRLEVESRQPGGPEAGWTSEATVGGELPQGFRWLGEWEEPVAVEGAVDLEGWTYISIDGSRSATPFVQGEKGPVYAQSRRRRMTRRAIRNPVL
ncbi:hypothetical protein JCM10213_005638 [Rhodosporidiobolus nylandii]